MAQARPLVRGGTRRSPTPDARHETHLDFSDNSIVPEVSLRQWIVQKMRFPCSYRTQICLRLLPCARQTMSERQPLISGQKKNRLPTASWLHPALPDENRDFHTRVLVLRAQARVVPTLCRALRTPEAAPVAWRLAARRRRRLAAVAKSRFFVLYTRMRKYRDSGCLWANCVGIWRLSRRWAVPHTSRSEQLQHVR